MSTAQKKIEYRHHNPNQETTTPGVQYRSFEEVRMDFNEKNVFYTSEMEVADMSCCGTGTCGFVTVYGYVDQWKFRQTEQGDFITLIEPIRDENVKQELSRTIRSKERVDQVNFR